MSTKWLKNCKRFFMVRYKLTWQTAHNFYSQHKQKKTKHTLNCYCTESNQLSWIFARFMSAFSARAKLYEKHESNKERQTHTSKKSTSWAHSLRLMILVSSQTQLVARITCYMISDEVKTKILQEQSPTFLSEFRNDIFIGQYCCFAFFEPIKTRWHLRSCVMFRR